MLLYLNHVPIIVVGLNLYIIHSTVAVACIPTVGRRASYSPLRLLYTRIIAAQRVQKHAPVFIFTNNNNYTISKLYFQLRSKRVMRTIFPS